MARLRKADQGLIFTSCLFNQDELALETVQNLWGRRYKLSGKEFPKFNPSLDYYSKEMGENLKRVFFWSNEFFEREELIEGKLWSHELEQEFSVDGKRSLNMDIGVILKEQVLLATSKPYAHRIYLRKGVWAELTYIYENKSYHFLPWTYPDYRCSEKIKLFNSLRPGLFSK
ncbi:MAG: DUF4416 family protein [Bacteriovoracaceae bacterium]